jgi:hypothetical protein
MKALWYAALAATVAVALVGGLFLGFFSCGGYAWHRSAINWVLATVTIAACLIPCWGNHSLARRVAFLLGVACLFVITQAVAAQFYPGPPNSFAAFLAGVWRDLMQYAC